MNHPQLVASLGDAPAAAALLCAGILGTAAAHKWSSNGRAAQAVAAMLGARESLARLLAWIATGWEAIAALLLLAPPLRAFGASMTLGLWTVYLGSVTYAVVTGRSGADCGCTLGPRPMALGEFQLLRLCVLLPVAVVALAGGHHGWPGLTAWLSAATLFILYLAADELAATQSREQTA